MQSIFTGTAQRFPNRRAGAAIVAVGLLAIAAVVFATLRQSDGDQPAQVGQRAAPYTQTNPYLGEGRLNVAQAGQGSAQAEGARDPELAEFLQRFGAPAPKAYYVPGAGEGLVGPQIQAFDRSLLEPTDAAGHTESMLAGPHRIGFEGGSGSGSGSATTAAIGAPPPFISAERMRFLEANGVYDYAATPAPAGGSSGAVNRR
jgi:hypothetical protein